LSGEVFNDSLLVTNDLSVGNLSLPFDVSFLQKLVFSFQGTESTLESDESITLSVNITENLNIFLRLKSSRIDGQDISDFLESAEDGSQFSRDGSVVLEVLRKNTNFSFEVLQLSLRESIALSEGSVGFQSSISNGFGFFNFKVSFLDNIGHGESFFEDGVKHKFVILSPSLTQAKELALLRFFVGSKLSVEVLIDDSAVSLDIEVTEKHQIDFLVQSEVDLRVLSGNSLELSN